MRLKLIAPIWDFPDPITQVVERLRSGSAGGWLRKVASCFNDDDLATIPRNPNEALLHINALGDYEFYGSNANGDAFMEKGGEIQLEAPAPGIGSTITVDVGNVQTHPTFVKCAKVYRDHNNGPSDPSFGPVYRSAHNDRMKRVELIVGVDREKFASELQDLANGQQISWSMSTMVPYDYCSFCGNKAGKKNAYCKHIRDSLNQVTKRGSVICMLNDHMRYTDISRVRRPADRTALTLRKVAGVGLAEPPRRIQPELLENAIVSRNPLAGEYFKIARKLAEIEKTIPIQVSPTDAAGCGCKPIPDEHMAALSSLAADDALNALTDCKIMISLPDFIRLVSGKGMADKAREGKHLVPGMFGRMLETGDFDSLAPEPFEPPRLSKLLPREVCESLDQLSETHSLDEEPVRKRTILVVIRGSGGNLKTASRRNVLCADPLLDKMVGEYALYQLRYCHKNGADGDLLKRVVLGNFL